MTRLPRDFQAQSNHLHGLLMRIGAVGTLLLMASCGGKSGTKTVSSEQSNNLKIRTETAAELAIQSESELVGASDGGISRLQGAANPSDVGQAPVIVHEEVDRLGRQSNRCQWFRR